MSFMLTTSQMYARTKTVTRRIGWFDLEVGDVVMAVEKGMGLKKGEKIKRIYPIRIVTVWQERLFDIVEYPPIELKREGFPDMSAERFIDMFMKMHGCPSSESVTRIAFEEVKP